MTWMPSPLPEVVNLKEVASVLGICILTQPLVSLSRLSAESPIPCVISSPGRVTPDACLVVLSESFVGGREK